MNRAGAGRRTAAALAACLSGAAGCGAAAAGPASLDLQQYLWRNRVLLVFASRADDPALAQQKTIIERSAAGVAERDLVLIAVPPEADTGAGPAARLRAKFGATAQGFRVVLVGKDGGAKFASSEPIEAERLVGVIDAMPMRRREMR